MIACHSKHDRGGVEVGGAAISPLAVLRLPFEAMFKLSPTRFVVVQGTSHPSFNSIARVDSVHAWVQSEISAHSSSKVGS